MGTPDQFLGYSRTYYSRRVGLRWSVFSIDTFEEIERKVAGPFWRWITAERIAQTITQHYRDGWDMGRSGKARWGGGRYA